MERKLANILIFLCLVMVASSVQAAGVNVNSLVQLDPIPSTFRTINDASGCPSGFAARFSLTAVLKNKLTSPAIPGLAIIVHSLSNGNLLLNPETDEILGGAGAVMEVVPTGSYSDGLLSAGETVDVPFLLCLRTRSPFQFFVDVSGIVTELVSVGPDGESASGSLPVASTGNIFSEGPLSVISPDGRFMVFNSGGQLLSDSELVGGGANGLAQVYLRDLQAGTDTLVSINRYGTGGGNVASFDASLSSDHRYVAFYSGHNSDLATDGSDCPILVGPFPANCLFVRDLATGTTVPMPFFTQWRDVTFSADSQLMAFTTGRFRGIGTPSGNIFLRDLTAESTTLVSANLSYHPMISTNGRYVAFNQGLLGADVYVRDLQTSTTSLVSIEKTGTTHGNGRSEVVGISPDGRYVVFTSLASDLVANDNNGAADIFIRDMQNGTTSLVTVNRFGTNSGNGNSGGSPTFPATSSRDARFVVFVSEADDLVANDANGQRDVFWSDLQTGSVQLVSVNQAGTGSSERGAAGPLSISDDGRYVVFTSASTDLTATNNTSGQGIFVRDMVKGVTSMVNVNREGTDSVPIGGSFPLSPISADGRVVVFASPSDDVVFNDKNAKSDVFVRPVP